MTKAPFDLTKLPSIIKSWTPPFHATGDGIKDAKGCWVVTTSNMALTHQMVELMNHSAACAEFIDKQFYQTMDSRLTLNMTGFSHLEIGDLIKHVAQRTCNELNYDAPKHGWTCFHCGVTFKSQWGAGIHFGETVTTKPMCLREETAPSSDLRRGLKLALEMLARHEPGDSRAVSDEFVALAALAADQSDPEVMACIDAARTRIANEEKRRGSQFMDALEEVNRAVAVSFGVPEQHLGEMD